MPLAPGLQIRTLVRPDGRLATVVIRRRRNPAPTVPAHRLGDAVQEKPYRAGRVPACDFVVTAGFTRPVARALAALGGRARPLGGDGVTLDGRRAALARVVAEANRCLLAAGRAPIPYPCVRPKEAGR